MLRNFLNILNLSKRPCWLSLSCVHMEANLKKTKYDGRIKKRQWQDRRSERSQTDGSSPKISKLDDTTAESFERVKRKKYAMLLGYCGLDYYGMQRNPGMETIEEDLLKALFKTNHITEDCYNVVQNMQFQRAARTDKGVSAVRQVISLKLPEKVEVESINKELPKTLRIFGVKKVTKGFNSKTTCDGRTYSYTLPTVAFVDKEINIEQNGYRLDNETFERVNTVLGMFVGTKNFHNFTSKKSSLDPSANRYIKSFICERPFIRNDVEFAVLKVQGQSFMLHQIRKMVALMLAIVRNHTNEATLHQAFTNARVNIPRAPGLGLLLEFVHYDRYNFRYGEDGIHDKLTWEEFESEVEAFKDEFILPTITNKEITEKEMVIWLYKLKFHRYDDVDGNADDDDEKEENQDHDEEENVQKSEEESVQKSEGIS